MTRRRAKTYVRVARGVTLIELLVVVAIIAILLATLLPGLRQARVASNRLACQANLRQITTAWHLYLEESGDRFLQGVNVNLTYGGWDGAIREFGRPLNRFVGLARESVGENDARLFRCPTDRGAEPGITPSGYAYFGTSYITNSFLIGQNQINAFGTCKELHAAMNRRLPKLQSNQVDEPSRLVLIGDYGWWNQRESSLPVFRAEWHARRCHYNVAFLDGHADFVRVRKGPYVTEAYRVLPFMDLDSMAFACQEDKPCE